jgi:hypothetical protein
MAHAVSRRPLTAEVRVPARADPREICGGERGTETGFSPVLRISHVSFILPWLSILTSPVG